MKWVVSIIFGGIVIFGFWNGFAFALEKVKRWYRKKVVIYRQHHHLPGDKVHRPKRNVKTN